MLLPKFEIKKDVKFFWDRSSKKLSAKCGEIEFNWQKNADELIRNFKIEAEKATDVIANEEIIHMREKI